MGIILLFCKFFPILFEANLFILALLGQEQNTVTIKALFFLNKVFFLFPFSFLKYRKKKKKKRRSFPLPLFFPKEKKPCISCIFPFFIRMRSRKQKAKERLFFLVFLISSLPFFESFFVSFFFPFSLLKKKKKRRRRE